MMDFNRESNHECPCKDCPDKGCGVRHDTCEAFLAWREKVDARNEAERRHHRNNDVMSDAKKKIVWRNKRYSRQLTYNNGTKAD